MKKTNGGSQLKAYKVWLKPSDVAAMRREAAEHQLATGREMDWTGLVRAWVRDRARETDRRLGAIAP